MLVNVSKIFLNFQFDISGGGGLSPKALPPSYGTGCVCQRAYKNNTEPKEHMCFKNWNFTSTAMEADIIVDGFKRSLDMHNLIYSRLIVMVMVTVVS